MDAMRFFDALDRVEHRHGENDWHPMRPEEGHGGPGASDQERKWRDGQLFRCQSCDDAIRIVPRGDQPGSVR